MERDFVLQHIENLTAQQLADAINKGAVTLDDLRATNNLDNTKRRSIVAIQTERENEIIALQTQKDKEEDDAWDRAKYGNENSFRDYIANFPNGK